MALFETGAKFPPEKSIERLSRYERMRKIFQNKQWEVYERAAEILKESPQGQQLRKLYIAIGLADIVSTKPADMLVGERPRFESGLPDDSEEQKAYTSYVEENDLVQLIHESCMANGYRGDAWIKARYGYRQDYSALKAEGFDIPSDAKMEPIVEHVNASFVFPETSQGNVKKFKAVNIATVEWVERKKSEDAYLNVERHIPGYIIYKRFKLHPTGVDTSWFAEISTFDIGEEVDTGRESNLVETGLPFIPVFHVPYKAVDDDWQGIGGLEKLESVFAAINDRLVQIDYILWKHSDPNSYGPDLEGTDSNSVRFGGVYIPVTKDDVVPGYMTWQAQLDAAFKELDLLISTVFIMSETPQWLFGTTMSGDNSGGTGTSHTDSSAIKARFMPILSKVKRIRNHYDKAIRDALYACFLFDKQENDHAWQDVYPSIAWKDGIPRNIKEEAEIASLRTGGKATQDVQSAIKSLDEVDDEKAKETIQRIEDDETAAMGTVDSTIFNQTTPTTEEATK